MENQKIKFFTSEKAEVNEQERTIIHYASTRDIDRDNEIVLPEGIILENYKKNPVVLWNHISWSDIPAIGKNLWTKTDSRGLLCKTQFAKTEFGEELFGLYKDGFLTSWSIGFMPEEWVDQNDVRTITKCELFEYSAVNVPANPGAVCLSFVKGIKTPELKTAFINDYLFDSFELEIKNLKDIIDKLKSTDHTELIKTEIANLINPKIEEINSKLAEYKLQKTKTDLESLINSVIAKKLS